MRSIVSGCECCAWVIEGADCSRASAAAVAMAISESNHCSIKMRCLGHDIHQMERPLEMKWAHRRRARTVAPFSSRNQSHQPTHLLASRTMTSATVPPASAVPSYSRGACYNIHVFKCTYERSTPCHDPPQTDHVPAPPPPPSAGSVDLYCTSVLLASTAFPSTVISNAPCPPSGYPCVQHIPTVVKLYGSAAIPMLPQR